MIYLCMPTYGYTHPRAWQAFNNVLSHRMDIYPLRETLDYSNLGECFNIMYGNALNLQFEGVPITRFVMLHNDVAPENLSWLDTLLQDMDDQKADLVSAVSPVKNNSQFVSIAHYDPSAVWGIGHQLSLKDVAKLPQVFGDKDNRFLVNTGCMVIDLTKSWRHTVNADNELICAFNIKSALVQTVEAKGVRYRSRTLTEDWGFSAALHRLHAKVCATRRIRLKHYDRNGRGWPNYIEDIREDE